MFRAAAVALLLVSGLASADDYQAALDKYISCTAQNCADQLKTELETAAKKEGYSKNQIKHAWHSVSLSLDARGTCDTPKKPWLCRPEWFSGELVK